MLPKSVLALACSSLALIVAFPSSAAAAPGAYTVEVCTDASSTGGGSPTRLANDKVEGSGLLYGEQDPGSLILEPCSEGRIVLRSPLGGLVPQGGNRLWQLFAADGTRIKGFALHQSFDRHFFRTQDGRELPSFIELYFRVGRAKARQYREDGAAFFPPDGGFRQEVNSPSAGFEMFCSDEDFGGCGPGEFVFVGSAITATVEDEFLPGVSGPELSTRTLRGTADVGFKAVDKGSGIAKVEMLVDGKPAASTSDDNGGKCTTPYKYMQPCKLEISSSFQLDSTALPEGQHQIAILTTDAAGLTRETPPLTVLVHNAPTNLVRPTIKGAAELGAKLTATRGSWAGDPTGLAFRWYRCPASVQGDEGLEACRAIPGATKPVYRAGKNDLGKRALVEVIATNAFGSESRLSFPTDEIERAGSPAPGDRPVLSHVRLSRKRFRVGSTLKKGRRGAVLAFTSSKAGEVSIVIGKLRRHGKPKSLGKLVAPVKAGRSRILISGEIGRRRLRPGPYEASIRVTDQKGTASAPALVRFRIIRG